MKLPFLVLFCGLLAATPLFAHEGHDHGGPTAAPPAAVATPRAEAQSELFELVASLEGDRLMLYLDRYADNRPVDRARIEIESGNWKAVAEPAADGAYTARAVALAQAGSHPLVFTVTAGDESDLLETTMTVSPPAAVTTATAHGPWVRAGLWIGAALLALGGTLAIMRRRKHAQKDQTC